MGHATTKSWKSSIEFFLSVEIHQLFKFFNFSKSSLFPSFFFIGYIYVSLCPLQHSLMANSSSRFFLLSECDRTLPLYAILNPIYSQILHVRSIWNSFKIFTVSSSAEEFANGTLKLILSKIFGFAAQTVPHPTKYLSIHPRSPLLSTWVTHVKRIRRVRGTFVQILRANGFSPWL